MRPGLRRLMLAGCSDVVVQIVDARNPLLFRCRDLEGYVKEVGAIAQDVLEAASRCMDGGSRGLACRCREARPTCC